MHVKCFQLACHQIPSHSPAIAIFDNFHADKSPRNQTRFRHNTVSSKNSSSRHNKVEESTINSEIVYKQSRMSGEKFHKFLGAKTWIRWR